MCIKFNWKMKQSLTKLAAFICFFLILHSTYAQPLTVQSDLDFLVNKIRHTYVGYKKMTHESDIDKIIQEIKVSTSKDTFANLSKLTLYFNDCHFTLFERVKDRIINTDTNVCKQNLEMLSNSFKKKRKLHPNDGYWINEENTVIIYLSQKNSKIKEGYVIESKNNTPKGFCNLKLNFDLKKNIGGRLYKY